MVLEILPSLIPTLITLLLEMVALIIDRATSRPFCEALLFSSLKKIFTGTQNDVVKLGRVISSSSRRHLKVSEGCMFCFLISIGHRSLRQYREWEEREKQKQFPTFLVKITLHFINLGFHKLQPRQGFIHSGSLSFIFISCYQILTSFPLIYFNFHCYSELLPKSRYSQRPASLPSFSVCDIFQ